MGLSQAYPAFFLLSIKWTKSQGFSKVRFLNWNDTNSGGPRCLPHFSYTSAVPNCILASDVKSVAKRPYLRLLKSPDKVEISLDFKLNLHQLNDASDSRTVAYRLAQVLAIPNPTEIARSSSSSLNEVSTYPTNSSTVL